MADDVVRQYLALQGERFQRHRRGYALAKVLDIFLRNSGFSSVSDAVKNFSENPRNGLAIALQRTINELQNQGLKPKSVIFYLHLLKKFLEFHDVPVELAWKKLSKPRKVASRVDRLPTLAELQQLIMAPKSPRLRLLIQLLCQTGMRINEALNLKVDYVDFENKIIKIPAAITKTGTPREVPLIGELESAIRRYLQTRKVESPYLFPSLRDPSRPWSIFKARSAYIKLLRRLKLDDKTPDGSAHRLHFHVLRKWFRTQLEGANINRILIDLWMGHNSGVEKIYYLPTPEIVRQEIEKADKALRIFGVKAELDVNKMRLAALEAVWEALNPNQPADQLYGDYFRFGHRYPTEEEKIAILTKSIGAYLAMAKGKMHNQIVKAFREAMSKE